VSDPAGCALTPQSVYGPYWIEGQPKRSDLRAGQQGIYLRLAMQVIDIATCKPLLGAQVDVWHANATGQYSSAKGGFLRAWQPTSKHGTVEFDTNMPGHYFGRATHIHTVVRAPNEQRVAHFGQIYFDQWLRNVVEVSLDACLVRYPAKTVRAPPSTRAINSSWSAMSGMTSCPRMLPLSTTHSCAGLGLVAVRMVGRSVALSYVEFADVK
jgi:hypothetical protein